MYETIKKFLADGGRCLLIEDGKPIGVVLTMADYEKLLIPEINSEAVRKQETDYSVPADAETSANESAASADINEIEAAADVTLDDLGINEQSY